MSDEKLYISYITYSKSFQQKITSLKHANQFSLFLMKVSHNICKYWFRRWFWSVTDHGLEVDDLTRW